MRQMKIIDSLKRLFSFKTKVSLCQIYTDGSLKEGRGSWAYVIVQNNKVIKENFGAAKKTTCTRMEFQAAIEALRVLPAGSVGTVYSDSRILVDTMTLWLAEWKLNDWVKKTGQNIPSIDQIKTLDALNQRHLLSWQWIKAHSGVAFNERCDQLCIQARKKLTASI